ncbi:MAG: hypothetical protein WCO04_10810, partial [Pseudomonadota bacterium]
RLDKITIAQGVGKAVARKFAELAQPVQLAARTAANRQAAETDLEVRSGVLVSGHEFDALACATHDVFGVQRHARPHTPEQMEVRFKRRVACLNRT